MGGRVYCTVVLTLRGSESVGVNGGEREPRTGRGKGCSYVSSTRGKDI